MEPFTLFVWLWMGQRFEQTQIENMGRGANASIGS